MSQPLLRKINNTSDDCFPPWGCHTSSSIWGASGTLLGSHSCSLFDSPPSSSPKYRHVLPASLSDLYRVVIFYVLIRLYTFTRAQSSGVGSQMCISVSFLKKHVLRKLNLRSEVLLPPLMTGAACQLHACDPPLPSTAPASTLFIFPLF